LHLATARLKALTRRFAFVLVLERCCLEKRRVNPIRSAFQELHPRSGLKALTTRFVLPTSLADLWSAPRLRGRLFDRCNHRTTSFVGQAVIVVVLVLEAGHAECGVLDARR
jgi:hypothetical protein